MTAVLSTRNIEKVWGRDVLPAPFAAQDRRIGEIWFDPPPALDTLLVKYLFTSDKLSVQVHPPGAEGKDECWLVLDAEPGAVIGIGFRDRIDAATMRRAALDGSIEDMLAWHPVERGDFVFIPAGTVHAIGAGVSLVEIQQNRDVTYRFYDYGRPRELHLDEAIAVAEGRPLDPALRGKLPEAGHATIADGPHFRVIRLDGAPDPDLVASWCGPALVVPLSGRYEIAGEEVGPGQCALAMGLADIAWHGPAQCLLAQPCTEGA